MSLQDDNNKFRSTGFYQLVQRVADFCSGLVYSIIGFIKKR